MGNQRHPNQRSTASLPRALRRTSVPSDARAWIERQTGRSISTVRRLAGASSTAVHRIGFSRGEPLVLRRYAWRGYIDAEPDAPAREVDVLAFATRRGLPVPTVVASDPTGDAVGDGVPAVLMSYLRGRAVSEPEPGSLARVAASIHDTDPSGIGHEYFPWYEAEMMTAPPLSDRPRLWETAIELWQSAMPDYEPAFIHRDFHPGNVLWWRGRVSGVVDWPNGCRGPVGCDLAHCRANLRALAGPDAADRFVAAYEALTDRSLHPFWIMAGHLEHSHRHWTRQRLVEAEPDLAVAVAAITG